MTTTAAVSAQPRHTVLANALPGARARDATLVLGGALLTALLAQIAVTIPPSPVPVTGQTLAVGLVGATLGARRGALALTVYLLLGLILPVYSGASSGWHVVWGPNGGYLLGFIVAAGAIGWLAERGADRKVVTAFLCFAVGQAIVFAPGLVGLKLATGEPWSWTVHNGLTIFIVGGLIKALVGGCVLPSAWHLVRRLERRS